MIIIIIVEFCLLCIACAVLCLFYFTIKHQSHYIMQLTTLVEWLKNEHKQTSIQR